MKLLITTGLYAPEIGGPATYTTLLEEDLPQHGITVAVVPFSLVRKYPKIIRHAVYCWHVWRTAKQADVLYALDPVSVGVPTLLVASLRRKKFMLRLGGDYAWEQGRLRFGVMQTLDEYLLDMSAQPILVRVLAAIQSYVAAAAEIVVVPSMYLKQVAETWGTKPDNIVVIYSALFPLKPTKTETEIRAVRGDNGPVLVTAGRLVPWKGVRAVINVVRRLREVYPNVLLQIVGDGPQLGVLQSQVAKYRLEQHVQFLGQQSKTDLANTLSVADVFVLNTAYEGLSHQLLEVMHMGVPIVTTSVTGNLELLTNGVDAIMVPFDDEYRLQQACEHILNQPLMAKQLVQSARVRISSFSRAAAIEHIADVCKQVYERT